LRKQTAAPTIAVRALGYGFGGVRVDGNDVLASYVVMRDAYRRARAGDGPTLVEAITYRRGPHSTADDPTRYRTSDEVSEWEAKDPIARFTRYCDNEGVLSDAFKAEVAEEAKAKRTKLRADIVGAGPLDPKLLFEHVYETPDPVLDRQYKAFKRDYLQEG
jgi:pyruvate dehydrogenase E1 component alpha subunit